MAPSVFTFTGRFSTPLARSAPVPDSRTDGGVGTGMGAAQLVEPANLPPAPGFSAEMKLRQVIHVSLGGSQIRVRISNEFGTAPLVVAVAHVARPEAAGTSAIVPETDRALAF